MTWLVGIFGLGFVVCFWGWAAERAWRLEIQRDRDWWAKYRTDYGAAAKSGGTGE